MKVYAELVEENGILYRTKTLIQFGNSWDLIGSIIMKNPGSATPKIKIDHVLEKEISKFYNGEIDKGFWYEFSPDSTIFQLEKLFNGWYIGRDIELNGVIQLFNLFNIREANLNKAKSLARNNSSHYLMPTINEVLSNLKGRPIYLGCFDVYTDETYPMFRQLIEAIFEKIKNSEYDYLLDELIDNKFYHPGYINLHYKSEKISNVLNKFLYYYE